MNAPAKLAIFAAVLAAIFGIAVLAGAALDPTDTTVTTEEHDGGSGHATAEPHDDADAAPAPAPAGTDAHGGHQDDQPSGLAVSHGGYTLRFERTRLTPSRSAPLRFRIVDEGGRTVRDAFQVEHEKRLHLVVVRRDTAVFRHVHPTQRRDGTWTVDARLVDPGIYRAFADFKIGGEQHTLAADLFVPGAFDARELPEPATTARAVNDDDSPSAIDVTLDAPRIRAGHETTLRFSASRRGRPVDRLEPYLGAKGHLVALREGDLAYLHVHPTDGTHGGRAATPDTSTDGAGHDEHGSASDDSRGGDGAGDETPGHESVPGTAKHEHGGATASGDAATAFAATFPTPGRYRLFLQLRVDGRVRTVDYTVEVSR